MGIPTEKDANQVLRYAFDDATNSIRTNATFTGTVTVDLDQEDDSVAIGDGTTLYTGTTIGPAHAQDVNVVQSVLPTNAANAANQVAGNATLSAINLKITTVDTSNVTVTSSALPAGASTSALQTSGNSSLSSIDGKLNSLGQKASAASVPVVIASDQSAISVSAASLPLPSGAATSALQTSGNASLSSIDGHIDVNLSTRASETTLSSLNTKVNDNYGVATGAVRTASQVGNASGAADFGAGTTSAQTMRVVLPTDQTAIPSSQSGTWNINNVSGTISLPTGASTSALQTTGNASLSSIDGKLNSLGQKASAASVPVVIASDQSAIAITAASLPLPTGAATEATLANLTLAQGAVSGSKLGPMVQGVVSTAGNPSPSNATIAPLSINSNGAVRSDLTTIASTVISTGGGATGAGVQRVVLPTDQTSIPVKAATPTAGTVTQAAITVGTTAVRATVSGSAPSATRSVLIINPDSASTAKFYIGASSVTSSGANRGLQLLGGNQVAFNGDAGDYYIISDTAAQTVYIVEQA